MLDIVGYIQREGGCLVMELSCLSLVAGLFPLLHYLSPSFTHNSFLSGKPDQSNWSCHNPYYFAFLIFLFPMFDKACSFTPRT